MINIAPDARQAMAFTSLPAQRIIFKREMNCPILFEHQFLAQADQVLSRIVDAEDHSHVNVTHIIRLSDQNGEGAVRVR
jgi:hypothetical protein